MTNELRTQQEPSGEHQHVAGPSEEVQQANRAPRLDEVQTIVDLFRYAYGRGGGRLGALKRSVIDRLREQQTLDDGALETIAQLSQDDRLLAVPRQLLGQLVRAALTGRLRTTLLTAVHHAMVSHPALRDADLGEVLTGGSDPTQPAMSLEDVVRIARKAAEANASTLGEKAPPREREALRVNAATTSALLMAVRWSIDPGTVARALDQEIWGPIFEREDEPALLHITGEPGLGAFGAAFSLVRDDLRRAHDRAAQEAVASQAAVDRAAALADQLAQAQREQDRLRGEIGALEATVADLRRLLREEQEMRMNQQTHASSDYEALRAVVVKRFKAQRELLGEGLHALHRDPPKVHVTLDRIERSISQLTRDLEGLEVRDP